MKRLFVALRPPAEVRSALLAAMGGVPEARWQNDNQLHLTLAFIGEADRHAVAAAMEALASVRQPAFEARLGALGSFDAGRADRASTLWLAVEDIVGTSGRKALIHLAASIRQALRGAAVSIDSRRFLPHITLARFPRAGAPRDTLRRWLEDTRIPPLAFAVSEFHLVESRMGNGGSHYAPLASYPLSPA